MQIYQRFFVWLCGICAKYAPNGFFRPGPRIGDGGGLSPLILCPQRLKLGFRPALPRIERLAPPARRLAHALALPSNPEPRRLSSPAASPSRIRSTNPSPWKAACKSRVRSLGTVGAVEAKRAVPRLSLPHARRAPHRPRRGLRALVAVPLQISNVPCSPVHGPPLSL